MSTAPILTNHEPFDEDFTKSGTVEKFEPLGSVDWSKTETFGETIPFDKTMTPEIDGALLPGWLGEHATALSAFTQTPPAMATMLTLAVVAACVQKRFEISPFGDSYREPLALWVVVALPPASRKTAVVNALTAPVRKWEKQEAIRLAPMIDEAQTKNSIIKKRIEDLSNQAAKATATEGKRTREELETEIKELRAEVPPLVVVPQHFVDDTTPEGLRTALLEQGGRAAVISDEGATFDILAGLYNDGKANIDVFLRGHAGGDLRVKRVGQSIHIDNISVTLGLAVQPEVVSSLSSGSKRGFRGKGLLARIAWVLPQSNIGKRDVTTPRYLDPEVSRSYEDGIQKLLAVPTMYDDAGTERPRILVLSREALELWQEFSQAIEERQGAGGLYEAIQDFTGKLPGLALRLAGLMHVAVEGDQSVVSVDIVRRAIVLANKLLSHAVVAFDSMGGDAAITDAKFALSWARSNYEFLSDGSRFVRVSSLHKSNRFKNDTAARVLKALEILRERHIVSGIQLLEPEGSQTGKLARVVYVNPISIEDG